MQHHVDGFVDQFEIRGVIDQLGAAQQQIIVVAGEAFKEPKKLGVIFLGVVIARKLCRPQLLHIPSVKVFVADQAQQGDITVWHFFHAQRRQITSVTNEGG